MSGVVALGGPLSRADITVRDSKGDSLRVRTDESGRYLLDVTSLSPPLALLAKETETTNCQYNHIRRGICMAAWRGSVVNGINTVNVNPLTDAVVSELAQQLGYIGPQQFVQSSKALAVPMNTYENALSQLRDAFGVALAKAGVKDVATFDPSGFVMDGNGNALEAVLSHINHSRGYDNNSGESAATVITDMSWRPVVSPFGPLANEPLQFERARDELNAIRTAPIRVFVVGDSTAATYERQRMPRMGWGQVLEDFFTPTSGVKVVNAARAGRSSRDFFNAGWYRQMARFIKPGDYVLIAHGHNDQNCNSQRPLRGAADVANLCTYPNDTKGQRQFPLGQNHMSFQSSLEVYIKDARARGAMPILLTPTTRYLNAQRTPAHFRGDSRPVVSQHVTRQNSALGYAFVGDYSQTIRDTASANDVPLIDLETKTIVFANQHAHDWQQYWLVVADTAQYPWYRSQTSGTSNAPDTTHFQEAGARAMAQLVATGIKESPALQALAKYLNN